MSIGTFLLAIACLSISTYGQAASFGDVTVPTPAAAFQDSNILLYFHIHHATDMLVIYAKLKSYSYFGLLFKDVMINGDYNIVQPGVTVTVRDCIQTGGSAHDAPVDDTTSHVTVLGYDTDGSTYVTVKYERPLNTGDAQDAVLTDDMNYTWAYAFASGSSTLTYHTSKARFSGILSNTAGSATAEIDFPLIHGIILTILWCLVADIAVWVKYIYDFKYRLACHATLMSIVTVGTIVLSAIMIARNAIQEEKGEADKFAHVIIGLIILGSVCLLLIGGIINRLNMRSPTLSPKTVYIVRKFHKYIGYIVIMVAKANAILGWAMENEKIAVGIVAAEIAVIFTLRLLYVWNATKGLKGYSQNNVAKVMNTESNDFKIDEQLDKLTSLPYNHPSVQAANFVIFDDTVYDLPTDDFHPGGQKIIVREERLTDLCMGP